MAKFSKGVSLVSSVLCSFVIISSFVSSSQASSLEGVVTQLIKSPQLELYWHFDQFPERLPLSVVLPEGLSASDIQVELHGQQIQLLGGKSTKENALIVKEINKSENKIVLAFLYPPEGIRGEAFYELSDGVWSLMEVKVVEA